MFKDMIKETKTKLFVTALAYVIIGFILIIWPDQTTKFISQLLAGVLIVLGAIEVIEYFREDERVKYEQKLMAKGVLLISLGVYMFFNHTIVLSVLPIALGFIILLSGVTKLQNALDSKKAGYANWNRILIMSLISIIFAVFILSNPLATTRVFIIVIGVGLLVSGITDLFTVFSVASLIDNHIKQNTPINVNQNFVQREENDKYFWGN